MLCQTEISNCRAAAARTFKVSPGQASVPLETSSAKVESLPQLQRWHSGCSSLVMRALKVALRLASRLAKVVLRVSFAPPVALL